MDNNIEETLHPFRHLIDPRDTSRVLYPLENVMVIAVAAVISGIHGWEDMEMFGKCKRKIFATFLDLSNGIPKHDVYRRVFNAINPQDFHDVFLNWTRSEIGSKLLGHIAIDGKTIRGSGSADDKQRPLHMVSAWACDHAMVFKQLVTEEKSNEITAIPKLLQHLPLVDALVTTDAMGCQHAIAQQIRDGGADYLFCLKGNQKSLHADIKEHFTGARVRGYAGMPHDSCTTREKNRGRQEERTARIFTDIAWLTERHENWQHITNVIVVERTRQAKGDADPHRETHYYISSKVLTAEDALTAIRNHWQVENNLHWTLDVNFKEDQCTIRDKRGAENLATLRHVALNMLKADTTSTRSMRSKMKAASWNDEILLNLLNQI